MEMPPRVLFSLFPWVRRSSVWFDAKFTATGKLIVGLLIAATLFSIDIRQTSSYQVVAVTFGILLAAWCASIYWRPKLAIRRHLPEYATDALPCTYWLEIENYGARLESNIEVRERLKTHVPKLGELRDARYRDPTPDKNWFDRAIGFPRWIRMIHQARGARSVPLSLPPIAPGASVRVACDITTTRRGYIHFETLELVKPDPLGLFFATHRTLLPDRLLSLPRRYPAPQFNLHSERTYQRGGLSLASSVGDSEEFALLRDYRAGDQRRHIHWRSFAKTGELIVKQYQDEYFDRHALIVDTFVDDQVPEVLEAIVSTAASLACQARPDDSILDLLITGDQVLQLSTGRGLGDQTRVLRHLAEVRAARADRFDELAELVASKRHTFASLLLVLAALDDKRQALVDSLNAAQVATLVIIVSEHNRPGDPGGGSIHYARVRPLHLATDLKHLAAP
ncbi:MAG: DUF58 domain-containing protein [Pseudomonadota bacterium]